MDDGDKGGEKRARGGGGWGEAEPFVSTGSPVWAGGL